MDPLCWPPSKVHRSLAGAEHDGEGQESSQCRIQTAGVSWALPQCHPLSLDLCQGPGSWHCKPPPQPCSQGLNHPPCLFSQAARVLCTNSPRQSTRACTMVGWACRTQSMTSPEAYRDTTLPHVMPAERVAGQALAVGDAQVVPRSQVPPAGLTPVALGQPTAWWDPATSSLGQSHPP